MSTATVSAARPPRVVADSNVFISALLGSTQAAAVLTLAEEATITLYASDYIFAEVAKVLDDKFSWASSRIADALQGVRGYVRLVSPGRRRITVVRDPQGQSDS
jgi:putative PIN family toxin of toxin-antitoxin system